MRPADLRCVRFIGWIAANRPHIAGRPEIGTKRITSAPYQKIYGDMDRKRMSCTKSGVRFGCTLPPYRAGRFDPVSMVRAT